MIKVHHLETSRSSRLLWLLEELGLSYDVVTYQRDPKTIRAPESMKAVHPLGRSPLLEIDGRILAESGAIMEYLTEREGKLGAASVESRHAYQYWLHYAEGSAMTPILVKLLTSGIRNASVPFFMRPIMRTIANRVDKTYTDNELRTHFNWIETALSEREYFAGHRFSAADVQMSYPIQGSFVRGDRLPERPHTVAWLQRMESRPAYQRALEKGGEPMLRRTPN
mgnify:CR=1 FL=1